MEGGMGVSPLFFNNSRVFCFPTDRSTILAQFDEKATQAGKDNIHIIDSYLR